MTVASIIVVVSILGGYTNRLAEVFHGGLVSSRVEMNTAAIDIIFRFLGAELDGRAVVFEGGFFSFKPTICIAAVVIGFGVLRSYANHFAVVLDRLIVLTEIVISVAAIEISLGKFRVDLERLVILADRLFRFASLMQFQALIQRLFRLAGPTWGGQRKNPERGQKYNLFQLRHGFFSRCAAGAFCSFTSGSSFSFKFGSNSTAFLKSLCASSFFPWRSLTIPRLP